MTEPQLQQLTDEQLIEQANALYNEEKLLEATRVLRQVDDRSKLTDFHQKLMANALICEKAVADLLCDPSNEWEKQGETKGRYATSIFYKVDSSTGGARLTCRMETPVPSSLLVPLLSVLNESELYHTWIPSWTRPIKLGVAKSNQLLQDTRGHQIIQVQCDCPWPFASREVLMDVIAIDDIDENGFIIAKMQTITEETQKKLLSYNFPIPKVDNGMERIDYDGAVLFRACPTDHPNYARAREKFSEDLVLLQFSVFFDAHMMVPQTVINFTTRTVIGHVWSMLLSVAEQVRDGTRKEHKDAIARKAEFYKWVDERSKFMLQQMKEKKEPKSCKREEPPAIPVDEGDWTLNDVLKLSL